MGAVPIVERFMAPHNNCSLPLHRQMALVLVIVKDNQFNIKQVFGTSMVGP